MTIRSTNGRGQLYGSVLDTIGNTPCIRINNLAPEGVTIYVKAEFFNPAGSVKDRLAVNILEAAEREGRLQPGQTVVEASSGNTGAERIASQAGTGAVMSAAAENSYDEAAQSLERVEQLVSLIPDMETLKEAVDHNTRVTAELAIAMTRMWELEAIQTVGAGQSGVVDAATLAEERRYMDFTLPSLRP